MAEEGKVTITLKRSTAGRVPAHRNTVRALGLRKTNQTVTHTNTPQIRGMIRQVAYLLEIEGATPPINEG